MKQFLKSTIDLAIIATLLVGGWIVMAADDTKVDVDVKTNTRTTILKDSDGDGMLDYEDPNPNISEIYIVKDDNFNGIVDDFEFEIIAKDSEESVDVESQENEIPDN